MKCLAIFVELRRIAPQYLEAQGKVLKKLTDSYESVSLAPGGNTRFEERIEVEVPSTGFEAFVSGPVCLSSKTITGAQEIDVDQFEREARVFAKFVEPLIYDGEYGRVGVLFSFIPGDATAASDWYADYLGLKFRDPWTVETVAMRTRHDRVREGDSVAVQRWSGNLQNYGVDPNAIRIDVDQYWFNVTKHDALNVRLVEGFQRAQDILQGVLRGEH